MAVSAQQLPAAYPGAALLAWLKIAARNGGISPTCLHRALPWLFRYVLLEPFRVYERAKYDRVINEHVLPQDPIFVLGHWRSGTSFLQELMSLDADFATCSMFQCLFPECSLTARGWLPGMIDSCASLFGINYRIQDRPFTSRLPAEEEIAMLCMTHPGCSNWGQIFPTRMREHIYDAHNPDNSDTQAWLDGYRYVVNKLSIAHDGERLILKSPMNTARLALLCKAYPNAKFIHIHRHPLAVFRSSRRLWAIIRQQSALQRLSDDSVDRLIEDLYEKVMRQYLHDRRLAPSDRLTEVSYERLRSDPASVMSEIYTALNLGDPPLREIAGFIRDVPAPARKQRSIDAELEKRLRSSWSFAFEAWNYE